MYAAAALMQQISGRVSAREKEKYAGLISAEKHAALTRGYKGFNIVNAAITRPKHISLV